MNGSVLFDHKQVSVVLMWWMQY